jgi:hypothetical protein
MTFDKDRHVGVIAQDVQRVLPEATAAIMGGRYLGVRYTSLIPLLIESVKELDSKRMEFEEQSNNDTTSLCMAMTIEMDKLFVMLQAAETENLYLQAMITKITP